MRSQGNLEIAFCCSTHCLFQAESIKFKETSWYPFLKEDMTDQIQQRLRFYMQMQASKKSEEVDNYSI